MGFKQVIIPMRGAKEAPLRREDIGDMIVVQKHKLKAALAHLFGDHRLRMIGFQKKGRNDQQDGNSSSNGGGKGRKSKSGSRVQVGVSAGSRAAAVGSTNGRRRRSTEHTPG